MPATLFTPAHRLLAIIAGALLLAGIPGAHAQSDASAIHASAWPEAHSPINVSPDIAALVHRVVSNMTLEEKVGQLLQADISSVTPEDVRRYHLGSVLAGGNSAPDQDVRVSAARWRELTQRYFEASLAGTRNGQPAVPVLFGIDAVHGNARIPGATVFPHNVGLGAMHDPPLMEKIGRATAAEVAAIGADWTFSPDVAVVRDVRWGRSYESYSEDPQLVAAYARSLLTGLQGSPGTADFLAAGHVLASVKHFIGDGSTLGGRDQFDSRVDEGNLRDIHSAGYIAAIGAGALNVMASYNGWQGQKMHANRGLLTDVLKGRWSFPGFVVGDWNAQEEIPGCTKYDCPDILLAGVDMYMAPDSWKQLYWHLLAEARAGRVPMARLDDAVRRIVLVKALMHRLGDDAAARRTTAADTALLGSADHRSIARQAVRESLVLLKNNAHTLPLNAAATILVAGAAADSIPDQCGGWTIDWQGDHNHNADLPGATSLYGGIRAAVEAAGGHALLSPDGSYSERPAAAIVIFGEGPYAEFEGDRETLELPDADSAHLKILHRLHEAGIPVVSVLLSGRPLWINRELNLSDALIAAWLPGSEGGGVADVIFSRSGGGHPLDFTGRLSFSWPGSALPVSFGAGGVVSGALFARGFGLSLNSPSTLGAVSEDPGTTLRTPRNSLFEGGHVTAPWSVYVEDGGGPVRLTMREQATPRQLLSVALAGDALRAIWFGGAAAELRIGGRAEDFIARAQNDEAIQIRYRLQELPTQPVTMGVRCEAPYGPRPQSASDVPAPDWRLCGVSAGAGVDITETLDTAPLGSWQTLTMPLRCAVPAARLSNVNAPFVVSTTGQLDMSISEVRLVRSNVACPAPDLRRMISPNSDLQ